MGRQGPGKVLLPVEYIQGYGPFISLGTRSGQNIFINKDGPSVMMLHKTSRIQRCPSLQERFCSSPGVVGEARPSCSTHSTSFPCPHQAPGTVRSLQHSFPREETNPGGERLPPAATRSQQRSSTSPAEAPAFLPALCSGCLQHAGRSFNYPVLMSQSCIITQASLTPFNFNGNALLYSSHPGCAKAVFHHSECFKWD